ncbi:MAG: NADH:ubiquinone reductase (Na(+)-transporting) subunit B [Bacteroidales bacterium]|nr:NADH:ubiquinone reductase (Na(+)-transporting) subunit B [Candidatus Liminaster caballi]
MKLNDFIEEKIAPNFEKGGKYEKFWSIYDSFHTFLFVPRHTAGRKGVQVHDSVDSKRVIIMVILALVPALLFGCWNVGYQHDLALGINDGWFMQFLYGFGAFLPKVVVSYVVGLGIEMAVAACKREEVAEGFLATGLLIPMIVPVNTPLWMIAVATAFSVVFAKEIFGGTGMNIFNPALITRAFLFFAYPKAMSGDNVFVRTGNWWNNDPIEGTTVIDGFSGATPLAQVADGSFDAATYSTMDAFLGCIPGSIAETSTLAILLGAALLLITKVASWRIMLSVFAGGAVMSAIIGACSESAPTVAQQLCLGGFAFAAVFMATDPVTGCRTNTGKFIYGAFIGVMAIIIRMFNTGYPEGAMMAVLLGNAVAPLIDYYVVDANINKRAKRVKA